MKVRAVDNFTASMVNPCTGASEKIRCDTLDSFLSAVCALEEKVKVGSSCAVSVWAWLLAIPAHVLGSTWNDES